MAKCDKGHIKTESEVQTGEHQCKSPKYGVSQKKTRANLLKIKPDLS